MAKFEVGDIIQGCTQETNGIMFLIISIGFVKSYSQLFYKTICINHNDKKWVGKKWNIDQKYADLNCTLYDIA